MNIRKKLDLLDHQKFQIIDENGNEFKIEKEGSLGLLAMGYRGIYAWKKVNAVDKTEIKMAAKIDTEASSH